MKTFRFFTILQTYLKVLFNLILLKESGKLEVMVIPKWTKYLNILRLSLFVLLSKSTVTKFGVGGVGLCYLPP
jgi:hypothetical protein